MKKHTFKTAAILVSALMICSLAACSAKSAAVNAIREDVYPAMSSAADAYDAGGYSYYNEETWAESEEMPMEKSEGTGSDIITETTAAPDRDIADAPLHTEKLVYSCCIRMQTLEYEKTVSDVKAEIAKYDGFIESENQTDDSGNWYYSDYHKTSGTLHESITVRIPTAHYEDFLSDLNGNGKIISKSQNVENISKRYYGTETTIKSLETQEQRLLQMMEDAESIEDMLTIEARLSDVQNELAQYRMDLSDMDTDVAYSTVTLYIDEVMEYSPDTTPKKTSTFGDRLKNTLADSLESFLNFQENLLFFLIGAFPYLLILAVIIAVIILIVKKADGRKAAKQKKSAEPDMPAENK